MFCIPRVLYCVKCQNHSNLESVQWWDINYSQLKLARSTAQFTTATLVTPLTSAVPVWNWENILDWCHLAESKNCIKFRIIFQDFHIEDNWLGVVSRYCPPPPPSLAFAWYRKLSTAFLTHNDLLCISYTIYNLGLQSVLAGGKAGSWS